MREPSNEDTLARWENEGGSSGRAAPDLPQGARSAACFPSLPLGYHAQPVWEWRDRTGQLLYEFHRVYRPITRVIDRVPTVINRLDEDLSFWVVTWSRSTRAGDEQLAGRWMSYAQVRKLPGSHPTFTEFSQLHEELPALLHTHDIVHLEPPRLA